MEKRKSIIIVGDLFPVPSNFSKFAEGDILYLFGDKICELFAAADYRICNLEGPLTDNPGKCEKTGPSLHAPTATIHAYKALGIDCCTLANNHITDAGSKGVIDTIRAVDNEGIVCVGAGKSLNSISHYVFIQVGGKRLCLYNVGETMYNEPSETLAGAYLYDEYVVCNELKRLKEECNYLIVVYHGGAEKFRYPSPQTRKRFHRMVDCGADMILSQHTHCVGSEEYYKGAYLLYGQGNFLFRSFNNEYTDTGLIVELMVSDNGFSVKKHLVNAIEDRVRYDDKQDFTAFDKRSSRISNEEFISEQFSNYCLNELPVYLKAYKGKYLGYRILRKIWPKLYRRINLKRYERNQLLLTLHSLRSEQNREIAIEGIKQYLKHLEL